MRDNFTRHGYIWTPTRRDLIRTAGGILAAGLLAPRIARAATFSLVGHSKTGIQNGVAATNTINSTGADLLICAICGDSSGGEVLYSDSKGNTWTLLRDQTCWWSGKIRLYYCIPTSVGSGHYLSIDGVTVAGSVFFSAFSGALQTTPADQQNGNGTVNPVTGTTLATGSITPAYPNELVVTACVSPDGDSTGLSSGTLLDHQINSTSYPTYYGGGFGYLIQTTATPVNLTWTQSVDSQMATAVASFKSTSSGVVVPSAARRRFIGGE